MTPTLCVGLKVRLDPWADGGNGHPQQRQAFLAVCTRGRTTQTIFGLPSVRHQNFTRIKAMLIAQTLRRQVLALVERMPRLTYRMAEEITDKRLTVLQDHSNQP